MTFHPLEDAAFILGASILTYLLQRLLNKASGVIPIVSKIIEMLEDGRISKEEAETLVSLIRSFDKEKEVD